MAEGHTTPPRATRSAGRLPPNPPTPEQIRRMEEARLKAKAAAQQIQASRPSPAPVAGTKRPYSSMTAANTPSNSRNAAAASPHKPDQNGFIQPPSNNYIQPARKAARSDYIDYDFSKMTDTKGGFLSTVDDPHNKAMWKGQPREEQKPEGMTIAEWERERVRRKLREARAGPYEPGISILNTINGKEEEELSDAALLEAAENDSGPYLGKYGDGKRDIKGKCRECASLEIDHKWQDVFAISVCSACKDKIPDKYSLLTKTEARDDYLLTDPELKDEDLLPHLERPNPHKQSFHAMQLFLRLQVEAYAFSPAKWGSPAALDEEYEKRKVVTKARKEKKFKNKLEDLKKRTRVEAYKRARLAGGQEAQFGQKIKGRYDRHEHEWGRSVLDPETGMTKKRCGECGMEVEELEF
ncbi:DNA repair protein [Dothidotthia symphoricarpi CBS 119687]|uniref:DNA repair protein RAD14 n=1 Tax=Dothidotthia symphoricarpi CBS 119687 TaxID=1392245 RepID=A0A6A6AC22_9PLEO|nr:DNA repair protein [Dothidotthia symphoricarpi CBS 119687]KAF2128448.1 DNA repair protein [Dothidotthia symphoricarpi CBS 119687]